MRAPADIGTGTFGKIGAISEVEDLKSENKSLRQDLRQLRDQLKSVIGTLGTFQIFVNDKFNKLDLEVRELKRQLAEKNCGLQSPRATLT